MDILLVCNEHLVRLGCEEVGSGESISHLLVMFADIFHFHHRRRRRKLQGDVKLPTSSISTISTMVEATNQLAGEEEPRQCSLSVAVGLQFERERRGCWLVLTAGLPWPPLCFIDNSHTSFRHRYQ
nr:hypothetical protein Iba_chr12fCG9490 [Ipomoea batatas]